MSIYKQQILEPITAISRLITIVFKPKGTKIAIRAHNIVLCEPKSDIYMGFRMSIPQGIDRYLNGDSREDIWVLNHVLCNFINWYILPYKDKASQNPRGKDSEIYEGLLNMCRYLCIGLKELQTTYRSGISVGNIQYYILVLSAVIDKIFYPEMLYDVSTTERNSFIDNDTDSLMYSTFFDVEKFKNLWTREELHGLCTQFDKCFTRPNEADRFVFKHENDSNCSVLLHPTPVDKEETNNSEGSQYSVGSINVMDLIDVSDQSKPMISSKQWPTPKSQANAILHGDLVAIYTILDVMDKRFTTVLTNSVKGSH